jgi:hypothetical protein
MPVHMWVGLANARLLAALLHLLIDAAIAHTSAFGALKQRVLGLSVLTLVLHKPLQALL